MRAASNSLPAADAMLFTWGVGWGSGGRGRVETTEIRDPGDGASWKNVEPIKREAKLFRSGRRAGKRAGERAGNGARAREEETRPK